VECPARPAHRAIGPGNSAAPLTRFPALRLRAIAHLAGPLGHDGPRSRAARQMAKDDITVRLTEKVSRTTGRGRPTSPWGHYPLTGQDLPWPPTSEGRGHDQLTNAAACAWFGAFESRRREPDRPARCDHQDGVAASDLARSASPRHKQLRANLLAVEDLYETGQHRLHLIDLPLLAGNDLTAKFLDFRILDGRPFAHENSPRMMRNHRR
jgi:hypothetical protein